MTLFTGYEPARKCTAGPEPGARAFMSWYLGAYGSRGGTNLGIFNCRTVRGGSTTSLHGEGRACDLGIKPHGAVWGSELADQLRLRSGELGVQCIIWNRRIWSGSYSNAGWRPYGGTNAHVDHIHVELSRAAARSLTAERVQAVMAGTTPSPPKPQEDSLASVPQAQWDKVYRQEAISLDYRKHHGSPEDDQLGHTLSIRKELAETRAAIKALAEKVDALAAKQA